jgi:hypothetical protein
MYPDLLIYVGLAASSYPIPMHEPPVESQMRLGSGHVRSSGQRLTALATQGVVPVGRMPGAFSLEEHPGLELASHIHRPGADVLGIDAGANHENGRRAARPADAEPASVARTDRRRVASKSRKRRRREVICAAMAAQATGSVGMSKSRQPTATKEVMPTPYV